MPKSLDRLNEVAQNRFSELKAKQLGTSKQKDIQRIEVPKEAEKKFEEMQTSPTKKQEEVLVQKQEDDIFKRIDALELPPNLSLAVSFIVISEHKKEEREESLRKAIEVLKGELI